MSTIGIDLGTTNSVVAIYKNDNIVYIPNRYGDFLTPSVVYIDEQQQIIVGKHALHKIKTQPQNAQAVFKRSMGSKHQFTLRGRSFSPVELSAFLLSVLKDDAEHFLNSNIKQAVISVPAYFNDTQRKATKAAAEMAGLRVQRLINEPTAAAMAYGLHQKPQDTRFIVLDLGGGTFDVSIMEYFDDILEVHASAGDNYLGGEDFLNLLLEDYLEQVKIMPRKLSPADKKQIYHSLQQALHQLSQQNSVTIEPPIATINNSYSISRDQFNTLVSPLLSKMQQPMEQSLLDANLKATELDQIVLVGGASRMPIISQMVAKIYQKLPARNIDPDMVVAAGASIQAALCDNNQALQDVVLTDVCPFSLGVGVVNYSDSSHNQGLLFSPIIERNNVVPASKVGYFSTVHDNQSAIELKVYQGESRLVKNNVFLGSLNIKVPRAKQGQETVDVRFSYDMNGLLEVEAKVNSSGVTKSLLIDNSAHKLGDKDIAASLKKLQKFKIHPRDSEVNQHLLIKAGRLYEIYKGDQRAYLNQLITNFEQILDTQDLKRISIARQELAAVISELEPLGFFD